MSAQLSRVLATREPLFSAAAGRAFARSVRLDRRAWGCGVANAALAAAAAWRWPASSAALAHGALFAVLVVISAIDIEHRRIPDRITFPAMALGAAMVLVGALRQSDGDAAVAAAAGALLFWAGLGLAHLVSPHGMGRGDVKLAVLLGMALGWSAGNPAAVVLLVLAACIAAAALGTVVGLVLLAWRRRNEAYPFGPSLAAGTVTVLLLSERVLGR